MSIDIVMDRLRAANPVPDPAPLRGRSDDVNTLLIETWQRSAAIGGARPSAEGSPLSVSTRSNWLIAAVAIAAIAIVSGTAVLATCPHAIPPASPSQIVTPDDDPTVPGPTPASVFSDTLDLMDGRHSVLVEGVPLSFVIEDRGWEPYGSLLLSKSFIGPQGAEAVIFWAGYPNGTYADPCFWQEGRITPAEVAAAVAADPGVELVSGPSEVVVGGLPAQHVVVRVVHDLGCDPGYVYNWKAQTGGAMWTKSEVGDTIRVWIIDMDGRMAPLRDFRFHPAPSTFHLRTTRCCSSQPRRIADPCVARSCRTVRLESVAENQIQRIIDSIRFDDPEAQDALESKPDRTQPGWATTTTASPGPDPTGLVDAPNGGRTFGPERHSVSVEGVPLSFETPTCQGFWTADGYCIHEGSRVEGWEPFGSLLLSKNFVGPQDAEALIFWSRWPSGSYALGCFANTGVSGDEQAPLEVANRISRAPGVEVVREPIAASVGGRSAQYVVVTVTEDKGCDPGYFFQWTPRQGGAFWTRSELGCSIRFDE